MSEDSSATSLMKDMASENAYFEATSDEIEVIFDSLKADIVVDSKLRTYRTATVRDYIDSRFELTEEAMAVIKKYGSALKNDTLIHGDYCLPNVMLDNWKFSAFIDVGNGGVGDRHIDLFWGVWTLWYNLKTNEYEDRFLDAYGRENFDRDMLRVVAAYEVFG